jgi:hypothetical protein
LTRRMIPDGLESPLTLAWVLTIYAICQELQHESGLLAVTLMGIVLANQKRVNVAHIIEFKENLRVLLISVLFIVLAARLDFGTLFGQPLGNWLFVIALVLVVRPASIFLSLIGSSLSTKERLFLSWMAPRGIVAAAVSAVFALRLTADGYEGAEQLGPLVFLVIAVTVSVYGLTARPLARKLGLADSDPQGVLIAGASAFARSIAEALHVERVPVVLVDTNRTRTASARLAGLKSLSMSILSEHADESIDLGGIGRLFALLPNDDVNSLACLHHVHTFGRAEVFQLSPHGSKAPSDGASGLRGRTLFGAGLYYEELERRLQAGWEIRRTPLTETFDYDAWRERYGETAVLLMRIGADGILSVNTAEKALTPGAGDVVIAFVEPATEVLPQASALTGSERDHSARS